MTAAVARKILLVDDDEALRLWLAEQLGRHCHINFAADNMGGKYL